jgi:hypothetical protein
MNFEAELSKFKPSLDIVDTEDVIYANKTDDVVDVLKEILNDSNNKKTRRD